jgi:hypothetical protein
MCYEASRRVWHKEPKQFHETIRNRARPESITTAAPRALSTYGGHPPLLIDSALGQRDLCVEGESSHKLDLAYVKLSDIVVYSQNKILTWAKLQKEDSVFILNYKRPFNLHVTRVSPCCGCNHRLTLFSFWAEKS